MHTALAATMLLIIGIIQQSQCKSSHKHIPETKFEGQEIENYKKLCKLPQTQPIEVRSVCSYITRNEAFLKIGPMKMEVIHNRGPKIVMFHELIYDQEIQILQQLALPRLKVSKGGFGIPRVPSYRVSESVWISTSDHKIIDKISIRTGLATGLDTSTSELLLLGRYNKGGYYKPHTDYLGIYHANRGNRIATLLVYLNDVEVGSGSTVFTKVNVTVQPRKGSGLFWFNSHHDGVEDRLTRHGGCPVLSSPKWVAGLWFRERGQEFRRPCKLHRH